MVKKKNSGHFRNIRKYFNVINTIFKKPTVIIVLMKKN
jgi:hypothetical protein